MAFRIIRVEVSEKGEALNRMLLPRPFDSISEAEAEVQRMAESHPVRGENREHAYWWYERQNRRYRLIVESDGKADVPQSES
jgi:hypothetical protein